MVVGTVVDCEFIFLLFYKISHNISYDNLLKVFSRQGLMCFCGLIVTRLRDDLKLCFMT